MAAPCPYFHCSIGNIHDEPFKNIIERGLNIKYFGEHYDECFLAQDLPWVKKYVADKIYDIGHDQDTGLFDEERGGGQRWLAAGTVLWR